MMFFDDFVLILSERLLPLAQHWEMGLGGEGPCLRVGTERKA